MLFGNLLTFAEAMTKSVGTRPPYVLLLRHSVIVSKNFRRMITLSIGHDWCIPGRLSRQSFVKMLHVIDLIYFVAHTADFFCNLQSEIPVLSAAALSTR